MTLMSHDPARRVTGQALEDLLEACVRDQIITSGQAASISAHAGASGTRGRSLLAEALGYVGGAVIVAATLLIAAEYWGELSLGARLVTLGAASVVLSAVGFLVPEQSGAGSRLRSVLWLGATAAVAGFLGVLGADGLDLDEEDTAVLATGGSAMTALLLWWAHRSFVQQAVAMVGLMATAAALTSRVTEGEHLPALAAWLVAAGWLVLGVRGLLAPRRAVLPLASAAVILTSASLLDVGWGLALALASLSAVLALAVADADLVLLGVGAAGTLAVLPAAMGEWFPDSTVMPFVLLGIGLLLVLAALWTARRRRPPSHPDVVA